MSYLLVEEVLDHCPDLPYRQFRVLVALAHDAKADTRQCSPGMEQIMRRANCRKRAALKALERLREQKLIAAKHSGRGQRAVYTILPMAETGAGMGAPVSGADKAAPVKRQRKRQQVHTSRTSGARMGAPPTATDIPTPTVSGDGSAAPRESGGESAQTILGAFIDWDRANGGNLTRRTIGQLAQQIGKLLGEGIGEAPIKHGLIIWRARDQHPSTLHSFVDAAMNGPKPKARSRADGERAARRERWMARAKAADAINAAKGELQ